MLGIFLNAYVSQYYPYYPLYVLESAELYNDHFLRISNDDVEM